MNPETRKPDTSNAETGSEQFVELLTSHQSRLAGFIFALLPSSDGAQDVLQETNLVLWRKASEFDANKPEGFWAWASQVARYQVKAYRRDVLRDRLVLSDELLTRIADVAERVAAEPGTRGEALDTCVERLTPEKKQMINDRYIAEETVEQISAKVGKSESAVSKMLFRIRRTLLECVLRELRKGNEL